MQIIPFFITEDGVKYYDPSVYRLRGESYTLNCDRLGMNVRKLTFYPTGSTAMFRLHVDNKKIKMLSKNVYNITNLAYNDSGEYACRVFSKTTDDNGGYSVQLIVLQKGITYGTLLCFSLIETKIIIHVECSFCD